MPNIKKHKRPFKKFRKGGKYHKRGKLNIMENKKTKIGGFPDTYFTPLTYNNAAFGIGVNTNAAEVLRFPMNEPTKNNTIAPQGWTTLKSIYDLYLCHMVKVKCTFYNTSSTVPCKVFITGVDQDSLNAPTAGGAISAAAANLLSTTAYTKIGHLSAMGGGHDRVTLQYIMPIHKFQGKKKLTLADDRNVANTGSTNSSAAFTQPTYLPYIYYGAVTVSGANMATNQIYVEEQTTWYMQFSERLQYT